MSNRNKKKHFYPKVAVLENTNLAAVAAVENDSDMQERQSNIAPQTVQKSDEKSDAEIIKEQMVQNNSKEQLIEQGLEAAKTITAIKNAEIAALKEKFGIQPKNEHKPWGKVLVWVIGVIALAGLAYFFLKHQGKTGVIDAAVGKVADTISENITKSGIRLD